MRIVWSCAALAALALAPPARADVGVKPLKLKEVKAAPKPIEVPYRLTVPKHILVRAKINGKGPFNFILDTGAPALFVAVPVAKKVGLKADTNGWGTIDKFEIEGGVVIEKAKGRIETPFQLEGMNGMGLAGAEVHGLIGYNLLAKYRLEIDFTRDKMAWTPLDWEPAAPLGMGGKGGGSGGLASIGTIMKFLGALSGRKANPGVRLPGFLGLAVADGDEYPVVKAVLEKGPAGLAGVKAGDAITHVQGRGVSDASDVHRLARRLGRGESIKLTVLRGKERKEITFKTGEGL